MNMPDEQPAPSGGRFDRLASLIGDLDNPFNDEERERDVFNEACMIGFQLMVWASPLVAAATLWIGGSNALPATLIMLLPWGVAAALVLVYALRQGVDPGNPQFFSPARTWAWAAVMMVLGSGLLRAASVFDATTVVERFLRGFAQGGGGALAVGSVLIAIVVSWNTRHRAP